MFEDDNRYIMDPNALSNLDPKLRETYERVMGTPTPASSPASPSLGGQATPAPVQNTVTPIQPAAPTIETPVATEEKPESVTIAQPVQNPVPMVPLGTKNGHSGLIKVLYVLGAMVFFTIYVFFWSTIFKIKLPF